MNSQLMHRHCLSVYVRDRYETSSDADCLPICLYLYEITLRESSSDLKLTVCIHYTYDHKRRWCRLPVQTRHTTYLVNNSNAGVNVIRQSLNHKCVSACNDRVTSCPCLGMRCSDTFRVRAYNRCACVCVCWRLSTVRMTARPRADCRVYESVVTAVGRACGDSVSWLTGAVTAVFIMSSRPLTGWALGRARPVAVDKRRTGADTAPLAAVSFTVMYQ